MVVVHQKGRFVYSWLGSSPLYPGKGVESKHSTTCSNYRGHLKWLFCHIPGSFVNRFRSVPPYPWRGLSRLGSTCPSWVVRGRHCPNFFAFVLDQPSGFICHSWVAGKNRGKTYKKNRPRFGGSSLPPIGFQLFQTKRQSREPFVKCNYTENSRTDLIFRNFLFTLRKKYVLILSKSRSATMGSAIWTNLS